MNFCREWEYFYCVYLEGFQQIMNLKWQNPCLKVLIAMGGWNEGSEKYSLVSTLLNYNIR